jgi:hypothetical protein
LCVNKSSHSVQHTVFPSNMWKEIFTQCSTWSILSVFCVNKSSHSVQHKVFKEYWENTSCWTLCEDFFPHITGEYCMLNTGKIYLHTILGNTLCWAQWEYWITQTTGDYFMLSTVGRFIYTKYWGILIPHILC